MTTTTRYAFRLANGNYLGQRQATGRMNVNRVSPEGVSFDQARLWATKGPATNAAIAARVTGEHVEVLCTIKEPNT